MIGSSFYLHMSFKLLFVLPVSFPASRFDLSMKEISQLNCSLHPCCLFLILSELWKLLGV